MTLPSLTTEQAAYVDGLQALTDFLREHPALIDEYCPINADYFAGDPSEMAALSREMGSAEKFECGSHIGLRRHFGPHRLDLNVASAQVCERVQVGEEEVEITDPDAPMVKVMRPVYETRCPESFLSLADA